VAIIGNPLTLPSLNLMEMNRYLSLMLLWCIACAPSTNKNGDAQEHQPSEVIAPEKLPTEGEPVKEEVNIPSKEEELPVQESGSDVYVTHEGDKYHTADCRYAKTANPVSINQAKADGKTACGICKPNSKTGEKQLRCSGTTAEGKRCQRMTTHNSGKCYQHRDS